ncbi:MAG: tripartite tricarboxylate transporter substrate binding protein [Burkholderiales bacterium]|nr:tripartite tricarboxylate transporter substrate binding protein [Burkholderiales bacterium]
MRALLAIFAALCAMVTAPTAQADDWPSKPITIVVPFPPGGSVDAIARILGAQLTTQLGQRVVVENRAGGSGSIGTANVAKAAPDGYTFVLVFDTHAVNPSLIPKMPFDTLKDLTPIMLLGTAPMAIVAHPDAPYKTFADVIAGAKNKPGSVSYASIGSGSLGHLTMAQLANMAGTEFTHIPYKGGGPAVQDTVAGHVPLMIGSVFVVNPQVDAKRLLPLAVTSRQRYARWPDVPTVAEQGFPGYEALAWWGFLAPAGTSRPILTRMHDELSKALKTSAVAEKLSAQGMEIAAGSPEALQTFIKNEMNRWSKVVRDNHVKAGE